MLSSIVVGFHSFQVSTFLPSPVSPPFSFPVSVVLQSVSFLVAWGLATKKGRGNTLPWEEEEKRTFKI